MLTARNKERAEFRQAKLPESMNWDALASDNVAPHAAARLMGVDIKEAYRQINMAKDRARQHVRDCYRLPLFGPQGALAVYGTDGAQAIERRKCRVKRAERFPYLQSPV